MPYCGGIHKALGLISVALAWSIKKYGYFFQNHVSLKVKPFFLLGERGTVRAESLAKKIIIIMTWPGKQDLDYKPDTSTIKLP